MKEVGILMLREERLTLDKAEELAKFHEIAVKMTEGRSSGRQVLQLNCYTCGKPGHRAKDCYSKKIEVKKNTGCFVCNEPGHWASECPKSRNYDNKEIRGNFSHGMEQGRGDAQRRGYSSENLKKFHDGQAVHQDIIGINGIQGIREDKEDQEILLRSQGIISDKMMAVTVIVIVSLTTQEEMIMNRMFIQGLIEEICCL